MKWKTFWQVALLIIIVGAISCLVFPKRPSLDEIFKGKTPSKSVRLDSIPDATPEQADQDNHTKKETNKHIRWNEIAGTDFYKKALPEKQIALQEKFFNTIIKTDPRYKPEWELRIRKNLFGYQNDFANKMFGKAVKYIQDKQFKEGITDLDKLIEVYPEHSRLYDLRAWALYLDGQYAKAISDCDVIINNVKNPDSTVFMLRGYAYSAIHNYNAALQDYETAMKVNPKNDEAKQDVAGAYSALGFEHYEYYLKSRSSEDIKKAINYYSKAIEIAPTSDRYKWRGSCYGEDGDYSLAFQDFDKALSLNPKSAVAFCGKGDVYKSRGDIQSAIYNYKKAIELDSVYQYSYRALMRIFLELEDYDSVFYYSNKAIESCKEPGFAYRIRGAIYIVRKDSQSAYNDLLIAKKLGENVESNIKAVKELLEMEEDLRTREEESMARRREIAQLEQEIAESKYRSRQLDVVGQYMSSMQATRAQQVQQDYYRESLNLQRQAVINQRINRLDTRGSSFDPIHVKVDDY